MSQLMKPTKDAGVFQIMTPAGFKKVRLVEWRAGKKYDTIAVKLDDMAAGTTYHFFRDLSSKDLIDTNLTSPRRIESNEEMVVDTVGLYAESLPAADYSSSTALVSHLYYKYLLERGYLKFEVNRSVVAEGPAIMFPSGYGLQGSVNTDYLVTAGVPSRAAIPKMLVPVFLDDNRDIYGTLAFQGENWMPSGYATTVPAPSASTAIRVKLILEGIIKEALGRGK